MLHNTIIVHACPDVKFIMCQKGKVEDVIKYQAEISILPFLCALFVHKKFHLEMPPMLRNLRYVLFGVQQPFMAACFLLIAIVLLLFCAKKKQLSTWVPVEIQGHIHVCTLHLSRPFSLSIIQRPWITHNSEEFICMNN